MSAQVGSSSTLMLLATSVPFGLEHVWHAAPGRASRSHADLSNYKCFCGVAPMATLRPLGLLSAYFVRNACSCMPNFVLELACVIARVSPLGDILLSLLQGALLD